MCKKEKNTNSHHKVYNKSFPVLKMISQINLIECIQTLQGTTFKENFVCIDVFFKRWLGVCKATLIMFDFSPGKILFI